MTLVSVDYIAICKIVPEQVYNRQMFVMVRLEYQVIQLAVLHNPFSVEHYLMSHICTTGIQLTLEVIMAILCGVLIAVLSSFFTTA